MTIENHTYSIVLLPPAVGRRDSPCLWRDCKRYISLREKLTHPPEPHSPVNANTELPVVCSMPPSLLVHSFTPHHSPSSDGPCSLFSCGLLCYPQPHSPSLSILGWTLLLVFLCLLCDPQPHSPSVSILGWTLLLVFGCVTCVFFGAGTLLSQAL